MSTTEPIRKQSDIVRLKKYFLDNKNYRDYLIITIGLNTALRVSDILELRWLNVINFNNIDIKDHICITEKKTGKNAIIYINHSCQKAIWMYYNALDSIIADDYIFTTTKSKNNHMSRVQVYRIIKKATKELGINGNISCHSLRKTLGYQAWKKGAEPVLLMDLYNHSSFNITKRYLGITQDDKDFLLKNIEL